MSSELAREPMRDRLNHLSALDHDEQLRTFVALNNANQISSLLFGRIHPRE
jgi:hypothetical protein